MISDAPVENQGLCESGVHEQLFCSAIAVRKLSLTDWGNPVDNISVDVLFPGVLKMLAQRINLVRQNAHFSSSRPPTVACCVCRRHSFCSEQPRIGANTDLLEMCVASGASLQPFLGKRKRHTSRLAPCRGGCEGKGAARSVVIIAGRRR